MSDEQAVYQAAALKPFTTFARDSVEKTDSGWQWSSGLCRDRICDWFGPSDFGLLEHFAGALAARSAPEAGKAVDETHAGTEQFVEVGYKAFHAYRGEESAIKVGIRAAVSAALASVPAPSGAEPVAWAIVDQDGDILQTYRNEEAARKHVEALSPDGISRAIKPLFYANPQAAPAEDVADKPVGFAYQDARWIDEGRWHLCMTEPRAIEGRTVQPVYLAASLTSLSGKLAEAEQREATWREDLTASEALRRWLGELLAVIHRDGGHYEDFAGTEQAVADAQSAVVLLFQAQDERNDLRRKLEERERIGKMMANAIYNVHQRGLHVNADDMDSLKECQEAWDAAMAAAPLPEDTHHGR